MPDRKLNVAFSHFSYGGNGGIASESPALREWWGETLLWCKRDERIGDVLTYTLSDTPIPMVRNLSVLKARAAGADILVMVDSDNKPDLYVGKDPLAKPFFQSSFDFLYSRYDEQLTCIAAPYCGPPPHECVYAFLIKNWESDCPEERYKLEMYSREHAAIMTGIHPAAAAATGLMMSDMRCFELTEPKQPGDRPWFYYEYKDFYEAEKGSTEDVVFSRNLALTCEAERGYNPLFVNWDAWAGHMKSKCVGKPVPTNTDGMHQNLRRSVASGIKGGERMIYVHRNDEAERFISDNSELIELRGAPDRRLEIETV